MSLRVSVAARREGGNQQQLPFLEHAHGDLPVVLLPALAHGASEPDGDEGAVGREADRARHAAEVEAVLGGTAQGVRRDVPHAQQTIVAHAGDLALGGVLGEAPELILEVPGHERPVVQQVDGGRCERELRNAGC